jgi:hypothetical protein
MMKDAAPEAKAAREAAKEVEVARLQKEKDATAEKREEVR